MKILSKEVREAEEIKKEVVAGVETEVKVPVRVLVINASHKKREVTLMVRDYEEEKEEKIIKDLKKEVKKAYDEGRF